MDDESISDWYRWGYLHGARISSWSDPDENGDHPTEEQWKWWNMGIADGKADAASGRAVDIPWSEVYHLTARD